MLILNETTGIGVVVQFSHLLAHLVHGVGLHRNWLRLHSFALRRFLHCFLRLALASLHVGFQGSALLVCESVQVEFEDYFVLVFSAFLHDAHDALELFGCQVLYSQT